MNRNAVIAVLAVAVAAIAGVGVVTYFLREPAPVATSVPPLPADAVAFGAWALIGCQDGAGDGACRLVRRVINNEAQRVVLSFVVTRGPTGNAIIVIGLPPSVVIPAGVTMTPAGGTAARGAVQRCNPTICTAVVPLSDTLIAELSAAQTTSLEFVTANGRNVNVDVGINGFAGGISAWQIAAPAPVAPAEAEEAPAAPDAPAAAPG